MTTTQPEPLDLAAIEKALHGVGSLRLASYDLHKLLRLARLGQRLAELTEEDVRQFADAYFARATQLGDAECGLHLLTRANQDKVLSCFRAALRAMVGDRT